MTPCFFLHFGQEVVRFLFWAKLDTQEVFMLRYEMHCESTAACWFQASMVKDRNLNIP